MTKIILSLWFCVTATVSFCQTGNNALDFNLDFESKSASPIPNRWSDAWGVGYNLRKDTTEKHSGKVAVLIEPDGEKEANTFGCIKLSLPANFRGKEIEVKAYLKFKNVTKGSVGLLLRIDGASGMLAIDNMLQRNIQGTEDWSLYSVKLPYPENAKTIHIGAMHSGVGQLWADDFQLLIDGKDFREAFSKKIYKADQDKEFDTGSKISSVNLIEAKKENLVLLGKVWGYLKYHHPAIARGEYNMDYELFRVLPKILEAKNQTERNSILYTWAKSFGEPEQPTQSQQQEQPPSKDNVEQVIKIKSEVASIDNFSPGDELTDLLTSIKNAKRTEDSYYIGLAGARNPVFKNENPYSGMRYPDAGFRLLSLYRYWNSINYFFPYKYLTEENWNDMLSEFIPQFLNASNELEYKLASLALIAKVNDTHANIWARDNELDFFKGTKYTPLEISFVENKAVVTGYYNKAIGEQTGLIPGDIIEAINGKPVEQIIKEKLPLTPASNYPTQLRNIAKDLLRTNYLDLEISYKRDNEKLSKKIGAFGRTEIDPYEKNKKRDTCFKMINPEIAYIYPGSIKNKYLPRMMERVLKTKGLIIDMRCYPSEFVVFSLSEYLLPEPTNFVKISTGSITSPGQFAFTNEVKVGRTNPDYYKGKVVIIVNETTQSQAEYTTMAFRTAPKATVIGSTTAGADGNVSNITLPGGINTMISGIGIYYPDGKETQRIGIVPDIEVKPTIKGIKEGKDELLERAIKIIEDN